MASATQFTGKRPRRHLESSGFEFLQRSLQNSVREIEARIADCEFELVRLRAMQTLTARFPSVGDKSLTFELLTRWSDHQERLDFMIDTSLPKSKSKFARVLKDLGFFTFETDNGFDGAGNQIFLSILTHIEATDALKLQLAYALFDCGEGQHCEKLFELLGAHSMFQTHVFTGLNGGASGNDSDSDDHDDNGVAVDNHACGEEFPNDGARDKKLQHHQQQQARNFISMPQEIYNDLCDQTLVVDE
jgi:hypothetical protein